MKTKLKILVFLLPLFLFGCAPQDTRDPLLIEAENGDAQAQFDWAAQLQQAEPAPESRDEIKRWLSQSATGGHLPARIQLSNLQVSGYFGESEIPEGVEGIAALAGDGIAESQTQYARMLEDGVHVERDAAQALALYQKASEQNEPYALFRVAKKDLEEKGDTLNRSQELRLESMLTKAGEGGIAEAYYFLGTRAEGDEDLKTAEEWYYKAAKLDHPQSMYRSGVAYQRLRHHPTYAPLGFEFLSKAFEAGAIDAAFALGLSYKNGYGVNVDESKYRELNLIAAALKNQKAIDPIILEIFKKKEWTYDDQVESAFWMNWSPSLEIKVRLAISDRITYTDDLFFNQVKYRADQMRLMAKSYRSKYQPGEPPLTPDEQRIIDTPYSARYGPLEEQFLQARSGPDGKEQLSFAQSLLDSEDPTFDDNEVLEWIRTALRLGNGDAGFFAYQKHLDGVFELETAEAEQFLSDAAGFGHAEAMYVKAKNILETAASELKDSQAVRLLLGASEKDHGPATTLAKQLLSEERGIDLRDSRSRAIVETMASEGNDRFKYLLAFDALKLIEAKSNISSFPKPGNIASELIRYERDKGDDVTIRSSKTLVARTRERTHPENGDANIRAEAQKIFDLAAEGNRDAKMLTATWQFYGFHSETDQKSAAATWDELHSQEPTEATKLINGIRHYVGFESDYDLLKSTQLVRESAEDGNTYAQALFSDLDSSIEPYETVLDTVYRATKLNDNEAMLRLSMHYKNHKRYSLEEKEAGYLKWIGEAAKNGSAEGMAAIGVAFLTGDGVEKNETRGIRYLEESAKLGDAEAQYNAGLAFASGEHIPKDIDKALGYLRMAAAQEHVKAINLVSSIESIAGVSDGDLNEDHAILNAIISSAMDHDYFPIRPFGVVDGELRLIVDSKSKRGAYEQNGQIKTLNKKTPYVFLADDKFSDAKIELSKLISEAPVVSTENGMVFTGLDPAVSFYYKSNTALENCLCLLVVRNSDGEFTYNWRRIGKVVPEREYRTKFGLDDYFFELDDLALYFFDGGQEVLTDARRQLQFFTRTDLERFTKSRNKRIEEPSDNPPNPAPYRSIDSYLYGFTSSNAGVKVNFTFTPLGFIQDIEIENAKDRKTKSELLYQLSKVTLYPKIVDGEYVKTNITTTLR